MTSLWSMVPVVLRRFVANARLLAAIVVGAVLAAALLSTTSIYTGAIRELGLSFALEEAGAEALDLSILSSGQTAEGDVQARNRESIMTEVRRHVGGLIEDTTYTAKTTTFYPAAPGERFSEDRSRPRSHFLYFENLSDHVAVVQGRLPGDSVFLEGSVPDIEVALGIETATRVGIGVGESFDLFPFWREEAEPVRVTVVGLIEPVDAEERYWLGIDDAFSYISTNWDTYPFFISEATLFEAVGAYLPEMNTDYRHLVYLDSSRITTDEAESVRGAVLGLGRALASTVPRTAVSTDLPEVLESYDQKLFFTRIPLLVLLLQIAAIVLYYLFMVSTMLVERQAGEIALLKSRGATTTQVMQVYAIEGLVVMIAAIGLGPPLAAVVISFLGQTPPFEGLSGGSNLQVELTSGAYLWATAGAILAYVTLLWPAYRATRRSMVQQRTATARPPKQPAFTRYYLDLVLVGLGAILYYQLDRSGSLTTEKLFGEQEIDPLRLLTPAFFILTVGIFFLRVFPLVLRLLSWFVARLQGSAVLIGMWQLVRNPVHYSRLVLLLMLATAVGTFAASFGTTLERSYDDRAAYEAGAGLRLSQVRTSQAAGPNDFANSLRETTGAEAASAVYRLSGTTSPTRAGVVVDSVGFTLLGIDGEALNDIAYLRGDYIDGSEATALGKIETQAPTAPLTLPTDARWLAFWFNPTELRGRVSLDIELQDATGRYFTYVFREQSGFRFRFGQEFDPVWHLALIDLQQPADSYVQAVFEPGLPQGPLSFESISIRFSTRVSQLEGALLFDDIITSSDAGLGSGLTGPGLFADPERTLAPFARSETLVSFDDPLVFQPLANTTPNPLADELRIIRDGPWTATELRWNPIEGHVATHGIQPAGEIPPLPVLASSAFLDETKRSVGDVVSVSSGGIYFEVEIVNDFDLFPTLSDPRSQPALIVSGDALSHLVNSSPTGAPLYADEVWLAPGPSSLEVTRTAIEEGRLQARVTSLAEIRAAQEQDPLVAAGWEGILFISFAAILLLSAAGFLIYSYLTAQKRTLEFAVLRTMGFSRRQIALAVGFEQFFIVGLGMLAGTLLGLRLGTLMIRYMGVTETGDGILPPMLLHVSWATIGTAWLVLGLAFFVTIAIVVLMYSRLALHRVLRIGES